MIWPHPAASTAPVTLPFAAAYPLSGKYDHSRPPHAAPLPGGATSNRPCPIVRVAPPPPPLPWSRTTQRRPVGVAGVSATGGATTAGAVGAGPPNAGDAGASAGASGADVAGVGEGLPPRSGA